MPLQVAVPDVTAADVEPSKKYAPAFVITSAVFAATVFVPLSATVAVTPEPSGPPAKERLHVCPTVPVAVPVNAPVSDPEAICTVHSIPFGQSHDANILLGDRNCDMTP